MRRLSAPLLVVPIAGLSFGALAQTANTARERLADARRARDREVADRVLAEFVPGHAATRGQPLLQSLLSTT